MSLEVAGARKEFRRRRSEAVVALGGVDLCVDVGELVALVGPSGSGKTTLLRAVAGLEPLDAGTVTVAGRDVTADPAGERDVALVFQDLALFPHLSVADNVGFGALARGGARDVVRDGVARSAATLGIDHLLDRRPGELSGGERQRVALARALLREPSLFLLDEPLSSLDAELRVRMREEVRDLQRRTGVGMLHVTHDQTEAMAIADRIVVLRAGRVEQAGPPAELWARPDNVFVAGFLGGVPMNLLSAEQVGEPGDHLVGVRPERLALGPSGLGVLDAAVVDSAMSGEDAVVRLDAAGTRLHARLPWVARPENGGTVGVRWQETDVHRFDRESGRRLP